MDLSFLKPETAIYGIALLAGLLIVLGLIFTSGQSPQANGMAVNKKIMQQQKKDVIIPVVQPKSFPGKEAPKIFKVESKPAPVMNAKSFNSEKKTESLDSTFEAYRQAMLASGPRQMEEEARSELLQTKGNGMSTSSVWREQTSNLRNTLKNETAASFLERTNTSINDRMVAIFDAVKA